MLSLFPWWKAQLRRLDRWSHTYCWRQAQSSAFQLIWDFTQVRMSELTQNPPLASYYMALAGSVVGWSERALHLVFLLPTLALVLGTYRLAQKFTRSPLLAAFATLLTPGLLVSVCSVMCDPMMLAIWMWAAILWIEGLEPQRPLFLVASAVLIAASELTKYFGASLILLLFVYSIARQRRVGSWVWYLLIPVAVLVGYEFLTAKMYGHGLLFTAADFSRKRRLYDHATRTARGLVALSYAGGCTLPALVFAPIVWSRRQIMLGLLWSGVASYLMMHGRVHLGVPVGGYMATAMRHHHWLLMARTRCRLAVPCIMGPGHICVYRVLELDHQCAQRASTHSRNRHSVGPTSREDPRGSQPTVNRVNCRRFVAVRVRIVLDYSSRYRVGQFGPQRCLCCIRANTWQGGHRMVYRTLGISVLHGIVGRSPFGLAESPS